MTGSPRLIGDETLFGMAYAAGVEGRYLHEFVTEMMDDPEACTLAELQDIITGYCIGEIHRIEGNSYREKNETN